MRFWVIARAAFSSVFVLALPAGSSVAAPSLPSISKVGSEVYDDSCWLVDSVQLDLADILTAPLYVASPQSPLRSSRFYLELGLAGAIWGGRSASRRQFRRTEAIWRTVPTTLWRA